MSLTLAGPESVQFLTTCFLVINSSGDTLHRQCWLTSSLKCSPFLSLHLWSSMIDGLPVLGEEKPGGSPHDLPRTEKAKCPQPCFSLLYAFSSRTFIEEVVSNGFPSRNGKQHGCNYASLRCQFVNNRQSDSVCLQRVSVTSPSFKIYLFLSLMLKMKNMWK